MITAIGAVLLPFCLWFWRSPGRLLELVFVYSVFSAAAVLVVGGLGITPALVPTAMFVGLFIVAASNGARYPVERSTLIVLAPLMLTIGCALLSSVIMPRLFEGDVLVWPQKTLGLSMSPLAPNSGNVDQDMYLLANLLLTVSAALFLTRDGARLGRLLDIYFISGLLVVFISMWQFAGNMAHVWFPTKFFLSNPGWSELSNQSFGSLIRLSGPFSEPSSLGAYLSASVCASAWVFWSGLVVVMLCTSTTGYATLALMALLLVARTMFAASGPVRRRVLGGVLVFAVLGGIAVAAVPVVAPGVAREANLIVTGTLNKQNSSSYDDRTSADLDSLHEMQDTYGLGVGWGSNRSSSLLPGLFAEVGVWGVLGFAWAGIGLALFAHGALRVSQDRELRLVIRGSSAAALSALVSALLSGPTITSPDFFLLIALLTAAAARARYDVAPARQGAPAALTRSPSAAPQL
ncbi:MAG: hypothetical protein B7Z80_19960 [Rhodospirillales bacterium 20-64-7]|nr:MAG: hypothetical protein B7Z80_19960 [Rhodospirillales bacterium 20-64-7]